MIASASNAPAGLSTLQAGGGHGLGNALYLDSAAGALLKVYRSRRVGAEAWREGLRSFGHRVFEGKRGTGAAERAATEEECLKLWRAEGCDVPALLDRPIPEEITEPALWLEYCPGPTLDRALNEEPESDVRWIERLAEAHAARHRRALELKNALLLQEHATIVHTLVSGDRLVTIDFENGYRPTFPTDIAITHELAGTLRSFFRRVTGGGDAPFERFVEAYPEREQLREAALRGVEGGSVAARLKRWRDRRRRNRPSKVEVLARVVEHLQAIERR